MNVVLRITILLLGCSLISEVYGDDAAADAVECYDCIGEPCSTLIDCPSKSCYKGIGVNGSEPFAVWSCLIDTAASDCIDEALAKAEGRPFSKPGTGEGGEESESSEEFREEGAEASQITIEKCMTCNETKCNGVDTTTMSKFLFFAALAAILALADQF